VAFRLFPKQSSTLGTMLRYSHLHYPYSLQLLPSPRNIYDLTHYPKDGN
jgi:hypothetical protein